MVDIFKDIVKFILIVILFFVAFNLLNYLVSAAYNVSDWVTQGQIEKAEELGAIKRTSLEVVNNYGEQDTFNPQQAGKNE